MGFDQERDEFVDENNLSFQEELIERSENVSLDTFPLSDATKATLRKNGFNSLFPIQARTFEYILKGDDLIGKDFTGSGKTLAYVLPVLERLRVQKVSVRKPRVLILAPTRELVKQIHHNVIKLFNQPNEFKAVTFYGGTSLSIDINHIKSGFDIAIATPGRILDLTQKGIIKMGKIESVILDETDCMLDMGFKQDIQKMLEFIREDVNEEKREMEQVQYLLFSATVPSFVKSVASSFMKSNFHFVDLGQGRTAVPNKVEHYVYLLHNKREMFKTIKKVVVDFCSKGGRALVFFNTKADVDILFNELIGFRMCQFLHGDVEQELREHRMNSFRNGSIRALIVTDVASRGLDLPNVDLVIHGQLSHNIESYVHRSGRTGRAGKEGTSLTFCFEEDERMISTIQAKCSIRFSVLTDLTQLTSICKSVQVTAEPILEEKQTNGSSLLKHHLKILSLLSESLGTPHLFFLQLKEPINSIENVSELFEDSWNDELKQTFVKSTLSKCKTLITVPVEKHKLQEFKSAIVKSQSKAYKFWTIEYQNDLHYGVFDLKNIHKDLPSVDFSISETKWIGFAFLEKSYSVAEMANILGVEKSQVMDLRCHKNQNQVGFYSALIRLQSLEAFNQVTSSFPCAQLGKNAFGFVIDQ
jgi:superfamily II DNA/RNA helicase